MMTLREFITKVNFHEQYRIYKPNRDCLIFESYFKVHSPYYLNKNIDHTKINHDYWKNNDYCNDVYTNKKLDEETKQLLDNFGECEVFSLECGSFKPMKVYTDEEEKLHFEYVTESIFPDREYLNCINVFII